MRSAIGLALLVLVAACSGDSSSNSTPTTPAPTASLWAGSRSVAAIAGDDTCLGKFLLSRSPETVRIELPPPGPSDTIGAFYLDGTALGCNVVVRNDGVRVQWDDYKCSQTCWWSSFECNGNTWSYCTSRETFGGMQDGSELAGSQFQEYRARRGDTEYVVGVHYAYTLKRQ